MSQRIVTKKTAAPIESSPLSLYNSFPTALVPIAETLDSLTGGWALSYANLHPDTPTTPTGISFLATNAGYALVGILLATRGDLTLGILTELAGICSFWYHFSQLNYGEGDMQNEVKLALFCDYIFATAALGTGTLYLISMGFDGIPFEVFIAGGSSIVCLLLSWVWEFGKPYIFWHSLWHILSAYTGYIVGQAHLGS